jgi:hypothetical protein
MTTGNAMPPGICFGPTNSGKMYISVYKHRGSGSSEYKNQWASSVPPQMEFTIFCSSDDGDWYDAQGHYWGVHNEGNTILGCGKERLAKFPRTSNASDPWHGYPVSPLDTGEKDAPPDDLVENWISTGVIPRRFGRRIQRRKV